MLPLFQVTIVSEVEAQQILDYATHPYAILAYALLGLFVVLRIALEIARAINIKKHQGDAAYKMEVMIVTVPKEQAEKGESGQQEKTLEQIQEKIAVMEGVFSSIGGLKAQKGFKAWFNGRE